MTNKTFDSVIELFSQLNGETVANLFLDYFGDQLIDDGFVQHIADEGYSELLDDDEDSDEDSDEDEY